jgi:hypothetical protein
MFLRRVLDRIGQGGTWTTKSLASELGMTPLLVEMMVRDLEQRGYLKLVSSACSGACASCSLTNGCIKESSQKVWTLVQGKT